MKTTITIDYANEVVDNLISGHGPDIESSDAYAYDLDIALPAIKDWLLEKMNDNYLRWLGGIITGPEYEDTMLKYSDLAGMIADNVPGWNYYGERFLVRNTGQFKPQYNPK
jgi:hypothetical protein